MNYEAINQGIAGCRYLPEHLAGIEDIPEPRLITVAYGTNDWDSLLTRSEIQANIRAYYQQLHDKFPGKPIYVITPIWRADMNEPRPSGDFSVIRRIIEAEAAQWQNMSVIDGLSISPHEEAFSAIFICIQMIAASPISRTTWLIDLGKTTPPPRHDIIEIA